MGRKLLIGKVVTTISGYWKRQHATCDIGPLESYTAPFGEKVWSTKLQSIDFREIAQVINFSRTTSINLNPIRSKEGRWNIFSGTHKVHTSTLPFKVLYLYAAAAQDDLRTAAREFSVGEEFHVVYPPSVEKLFKGKTEFGAILNRARGVWTTRDYFASFIKDELQTYLTKLKVQAPIDYIDPQVETPSGFVRKLPNPLLSFLRDPESERDTGKLGVLLAEPGQGKTYMSRHLVSKISEQGRVLVPLMVDSSQWQTMALEDQKDLAKTIAHSFRHFGAPIGWLEGHEEDFLRATLTADIFRIVFDGFDEYVLRNHGAVQPMEVLEALAELAKVTGSRIVITSRSSFWNTNLSTQEVDSFIKETGSYIFKILPFNLEHAKNYFNHRFHSSPKAEQAARVYSVLRQKNDEFVGRGFVLSLVADLAETGDASEFREPEPSRALFWLLEHLCQREVLRQQLPLTSEEQLGVFGTFAVDVAEGGMPNTELLELAINVVKPAIDSPAIKDLLEKFKSHPLLEKDAISDVWRFKQDQLRILFLAKNLVRWEPDKMWRFVTKAKLDPGSWQDLGTTVVDLLRSESSSEKTLLALQSLIQVISQPRKDSQGRIERADEGSKLAAVIALTAVERFAPRGRPHAERRELLTQLCGATIANLSFAGTISGFDFRGATFDRCRFDNISWVNCSFDPGTKFSHCSFIGGENPIQSKGLGDVQYIECRRDQQADALINSIQVREGKRKYSTEDLRADIHSVISKFVIRGGIGLKSVEERNLSRGPISASLYKTDVIDVLKSTVLQTHKISGQREGYNIREEAEESVRFYAANNVFTGPLRLAFERLMKATQNG
jgi:hypothetical protein